MRILSQEIHHSANTSLFTRIWHNFMSKIGFSVQGERTAAPGTQFRSQVSLLTLNIYFGQGKTIRTPALIALICASDVEFVCLQEVTPFVHDLFLSHAVLCDKYHLSPFTCDNYGVLMLVRKSLGEVCFTEYELPTEMDRTLLVAVVGAVVVATVHLESLSFPGMRRRQLVAAEEILRPYKHAVLAGDFNFDATRNFKPARKKRMFSGEGYGGNNLEGEDGGGEGSRRGDENREPLENQALHDILPAYTDVWTVLHPDDVGYTFDSQRNGTINQYEQMRYDRVLSRGLHSRHIQLVGTAKLPTQRQVLDAGGWEGFDIGLLADGGDTTGTAGGSGTGTTPASTPPLPASPVPAPIPPPPAAGAAVFSTPPHAFAPLCLPDPAAQEDEETRYLRAHGSGGLWLSDHFGLCYKFSVAE